MTTVIPTSPLKNQMFVVPPVTAALANPSPTKMDVAKKFTLNYQQKYAFMIITSHLDGENEIYTGR